MPKGITEMVTFAITVAFAIPVGMLGVRFLLSDRLVLGMVFVGLAVLIVVVEEYITTPSDLPVLAVQRVVGTIAKTEDETDHEGDRS